VDTVPAASGTEDAAIDQALELVGDSLPSHLDGGSPIDHV
jgi:hypothetical protein